MAENNINTRSQLLLAGYTSKMSASMQEAFEKGQLKFSDGYYFKRFKLPVSASGLQNILLNDDAQTDGFCSISKQKINQGCAFMADRFTFKVAFVDTSASGAPTYAQVSAGEVEYKNVDTIAQTLPVLASAELEFTVNGVTQWTAPVNAFNHETLLANSDKDGINVSAPCFINDEQLMQFRLKLPQGLSISSSYAVCVEVVMYGAECRISR
jgi:hypothetical protein